MSKHVTQSSLEVNISTSIRTYTNIVTYRVFQKKKFFSFPILAFFIVNNMEKYSHTKKKSAQNVDKKVFPLAIKVL